MPRGLDTYPSERVTHRRPRASEMSMAPSPRTEPCPCEEARPHAEAEFSGWVTELVRAHRSRLVAVARHEGLGAEDAFDAAQEAFAAFLILPQARELAPSEWAGHTLVALVRNVTRNARRLHAVARPHVSDDATVGALADAAPTPDERLAAGEDRGRLARCVARLAEVQRAVVTLRMLDDRPAAAVARELGLAPGHVAVLLHRAKADLRACLQGHMGDDEVAA
jgi:RNA polymerase sigma-70 factor (ECF subfamily)